MTHPAIHTADELLRLEIPGKRTELVRGRLLVREPPGLRHSKIGMELALAMANFVKPRDLGLVIALDTGFKLANNPDTVRAPDVSFIRKDRLPNPTPDGYADFAPDLVVEVLSPNDRPGYVHGKVSDWLLGGTRLVWIIDPARRMVRVYRPDGPEDVVLEGEVLDGEDVLPGFTFALKVLF